MAEDIVRVLRVIEYVGPRAAIEEHLKNVVHGVKTFGVKNNTGEIEVRASTVGVTADIIEMGKVEELLPPVTILRNQ